MGFKRKLKRSYFFMFVIPSLIIVLIATCVLVIVSERYEQQLENISDEAILTAAVQSVIKDFKEVDEHREERSYHTMTAYLAESGYSLFITADGVEKCNTLTQEDLVIMDKYDDSLYESEDFMTIDNGTASVIKQRFIRRYHLLFKLFNCRSNKTPLKPAAVALTAPIKQGFLNAFLFRKPCFFFRE